MFLSKDFNLIMLPKEQILKQKSKSPVRLLIVKYRMCFQKKYHEIQMWKMDLQYLWEISLPHVHAKCV